MALMDLASRKAGRPLACPIEAAGVLLKDSPAHCAECKRRFTSEPNVGTEFPCGSLGIEPFESFYR